MHVFMKAFVAVVVVVVHTVVAAVAVVVVVVGEREFIRQLRICLLWNKKKEQFRYEGFKAGRYGV